MLLLDKVLALLPLLSFPSSITFQPEDHSIAYQHQDVSIITSQPFPKDINLLSATIEDLQAYLSNGTITSVMLTQAYLDNIEANNHKGRELRAVIETTPYDIAMDLARHYDDLRANGTVLSGLHGIPILVKDNVATSPDLGLNTTSGSFALLSAKPVRDAPVVAKLRKAGVIILGKANLSQWSGAKGTGLHNGWSSRGGQTQSPWIEHGFDPANPEDDGEGDPCGSSSGSAVGLAAGFAAATIGSETDGSIICPSSRAGVYGLKMTVGLSSRTLVVPISTTQDTLGPMTRSAYDAALMLENMVGYDPKDPYTHLAANHTHMNYTQFTMGAHRSWAGKRLGVPREIFWDIPTEEDMPSGTPLPNMNLTYETRVAGEKALEMMKNLGATLVDPANVPNARAVVSNRTNEMAVTGADFKVDLENYLLETQGGEVKNVIDVVNWNDAHADVELPKDNCCQEAMIRFITSSIVKGDDEYAKSKAENYEAAAALDEVMNKYNLDALVMPSDWWVSSIPAIAGYPIANVPLGYRESNGRPYGLAFIGRKWSEPTLLSLMAAFEHSFPARQVPKWL